MPEQSHPSTAVAPPGGLAARANGEVDAVLDMWKRGLIDLTGRNRLLNYREFKTSNLQLTHMAAPELIARLLAKGFVDIDAAEEQTLFDTGVWAPEPGMCATASSPTDTLARTTALRRRTTATLAEKGIHTLYLAAGFLTWADPADTSGTALTSPLLLMAVRLETLRRTRPRIVWVDDPMIVNPALDRRLRDDLTISLPAAPELAAANTAPDELDAWFAAVQQLVDPHGWEVSSRADLAILTFHKEVMFRDLEDHSGDVNGHPVIRALATGGAHGHIAEGARHPQPRDLLVLDSDASQREVVSAALASESFVLFGPPGTGKSQTIANTIAELVRVGKRVLFVAEKGAAIDAVHKRLGAVGLGDHLLDLHGPTPDRKRLASTLVDTAEAARAARPGRVASPRTADPTPIATELEDVRGRLAEYGAALQEPRGALGWTIYDLVGKAEADRQTLIGGDIEPQWSTALNVADLTAAELDAVLSAMTRVHENWDLLTTGTSIPWEWVDTTTLNDLGAPRVLDHVIALRRAWESLLAPLAALADTTGCRWAADPANRSRIERLLGHLTARADVPAELLAAPPERLTAAVAGLDAQVRQLRDVTDRGHSRFGAGWTAVPEENVAALEHHIAEVTLNSLLSDTGPATSTSMTARAATIDVAAATLDAVDAAAAGLRAALSDRWPDVAVNLRTARQVASLVLVMKETVAVRRQWIDPATHAAVAAVAGRLRDAWLTETSAATAAGTTFNDAVLNDEFAALAAQLEGMTKLGSVGQKGSLRRRLSEFTFTDKPGTDVLAQLPLALEWRRARTERIAAEQDASLLDELYAGPATNWTAIGHALRVAAHVYETLVQAPELAPLLALLTTDARAELAAILAAEHLAAAVDSWERTTVNASALDASRLAELSLDRAVGLCRQASSQLTALAQAADDVEPYAGPARSTDALAELCELWRDHQRLVARLDREGPAHAATLGALYEGPHTDLDKVAAAAQWVESIRALCDEPGPLPAELASCPTTERHDLTAAFAEFERTGGALLDLLTPDGVHHLIEGIRTALGADGAVFRSFGDTFDLVGAWRHAKTALDALDAAGVRSLVDTLVAAEVPADMAMAAFRYTLYAAAAERTISTDPRLANESRKSLEDQLAAFRTLDRAAMDNVAPQLVRSAIHTRYNAMADPRAGLGLLTREARKVRRHRHVRELLANRDVRDVIQTLAPCFMMSPLSVSQFLPPGVHFDVVIFDEASQVLPEDALNAVYRADQLIVAGDDRQMPPTSFFAKGDDEYEPDDTDEFGDAIAESKAFTSLLEIALATPGVRRRVLRWHYRSQHESLIAFSRSRYYEDTKMVVFPSADASSDDLGVHFTYVPDGVFDSGAAGTRTNIVEARVVVDVVLNHLLTHPERSIGVVAFSRPQAALISELLEQEILNSALDVDFDDPINGLFVKNLENVQGDDRDIIVLSVGYGPNAHAKMPTNFGPLSQQGAARRLNVAVTRARLRCDVISSLRASDIGESAKGAGELRAYLDFAERGAAALVELIDLEADVESEFERQVVELLRSWGYDVQPQVGVTGYRIDIGVRHPDRPGRFVLGIECDGAAYHSSRDARERDRLREEVLRGLGWDIYRIWGPTWFRFRPAEEARLREALRTRLSWFAPEPVRFDQRAAAPAVEAEAIDQVEAEASVAVEVDPMAADAVPESNPDSVLLAELLEVVDDSGRILGKHAYEAVARRCGLPLPLHRDDRRTLNRLAAQALRDGDLRDEVPEGVTGMLDRYFLTVE